MGLKKRGGHWRGNRYECVVKENEIVPTITASNIGKNSQNNPLALVSPKSTSTPSKSTASTFRTIPTSEMSQELFPKNCQTSISCAEDSLVRLSALLGKEEDLKILEEHSSLRSLGSLGLKDLNYCSWKTSKDFCHTITGEPLELSSQPFLTWGIFANGRYLTARVSESHKIGKGCSLSDILETEVDEKYFLSERLVNTLLNKDHQPIKLVPRLERDTTNRGGEIPS